MGDAELGTKAERAENIEKVTKSYDEAYENVKKRYEEVLQELVELEASVTDEETLLNARLFKGEKGEEILKSQARSTLLKANMSKKEAYFKKIEETMGTIKSRKERALESLKDSTPLSALKQAVNDSEDITGEALNGLNEFSEAVESGIQENTSIFQDIVNTKSLQQKVDVAKKVVEQYKEEVEELKKAINEKGLDKDAKEAKKRDLNSKELELKDAELQVKNGEKRVEDAENRKKMFSEIEADLRKVLSKGAETAEEEAEKAKRKAEEEAKKAADEAKKMSDEAKAKAKEAMEKALKLKDKGKKDKDKGKGAKNKPDKPSPIQKAESVAGSVEEEVEQEIEEVSSPIVRSIGRIPPSVYLLVMAIGGLYLGATLPMPFVYFMIFMTLFYVVSSLHRRNQGRQSGRWF